MTQVMKSGAIVCIWMHRHGIDVEMGTFSLKWMWM
jgi:hypothetical protein